MKRRWMNDMRLNKGLTQAQVAESVGIARAYYTEIENGVKTPSPNVAQKLAVILDFDWTIFFTTDCSEKLQKNKNN